MVRRQSNRKERVALPPTPKQPQGAARQQRTLRLPGFSLTMLGLLVLAVIVLAPSLKLIIEQQQQIAALQAGVSAKQQQLDELSGQVARWSDPAYIESQARERLLYVYPGEYSYLVIDDGTTQKTSDGAPISASIQTTKVDWVKSLLSSVLTAGLSDATPTKLVSPVIGGTK